MASKSNSIFQLIIYAFFMLFLGEKIKAEITLPKLFADHMVLQRDAAVPIWGWASPGEEIAVSIADQSVNTNTDEEGVWKVQLSPQPAGGSFDMVVKGENKIVISDVLFGDVWLCGGQSNMQWTLDQIAFDKSKTEHINNANLRFITVEVDLDYFPKKDIKGGRWTVSSAKTIGSFSAVAYFFGRYLQESLNVPIGLISSNLGATSIETWMSAGALKQFPQFEEVINNNLASGKNFAQLYAELEEYRKEWDEKFYLKNDPGIIQNWQDPATDISDWMDIEIPNLWEDVGLENHDGSVWFRKEFDLPEGFDGETFNIPLNQIDDYDIAWVNGVKIGENFGSRNWRNYFFSSKILKPKGNILVVRIFDVGGKGGMYSNAFWGNPILNGKWKYKPGVKIDAAKFPKPEVPNGSFFTHPSLLYNGSIAPLHSFAIKGAIWYQGESNADRAVEYGQLLPAMIQDWRQAWGQGDFPFLVVQLANHHPELLQSGESDWAEIRESQAKVLSLPNTAIACTIDIGEADDIHPKNKLDVGIRLGLAARKIAYGENTVHSGPVYNTMKVEDGKIKIEFNSIGSGLISKDKYGYLRGFSIAGNDKKFHWARAFIKGNSVVIYSPQVERPIAVRYAWADNPGQLDLYNKEGLPALPFRTDGWKLSTTGKVFVFDEHGF